MKALLINGSPHEKGCTYTALEELAKTLEAEGIETEIVQAGHTAHSCNACASCKKTFRCVYDDLVNETAPKLAEADALVIGAPVYFASPAGGAIAFMDRLFYSTYTALEELAKTLEAEGIETEIVQAGHTAHSCNACASCKKTFRCVYDDLVNETAPKLAEADALVIGAPVYFASPAGGAIAFMDRLFYSTPHINKTMKVGAAVVSCRRGGNTASFDVLNKYFTITGMPIASSQYWNMVYGNTPEEVRKDGEGLQTMRTLGRNMAFLMKSIQLGREQFGIPEKESAIVTSFHHE